MADADSRLPLQAAVYQALRTNARLVALVGDGGSPERARVFDEVPQETWPAGTTADQAYLVIGVDWGATDWDSKSFRGAEVTLTVHAWSRYAGTKEVKQLAAAVREALDNVALSVSGQTLVLCRFQFATDFLEPDGRTRHGVVRFRALTQPS